jgi:SAM-dependent methyltransferase
MNSDKARAEQNTHRSRSFGRVAEEYERYRPGYPRSLVEAIIAVSGEPIRTAIEIGAGTGKATRVFARAGIAVTAVEPDPQMLVVLRRECSGLPVTAINAAFEDLDVAAVGRYDLLYAAAALHWTQPEGRWDRVAALLTPGGVVASFGGPIEVADPGLGSVVAELDEKYGVSNLFETSGPLPTTGDLDWPGSELAADARFTDVEQRTVRREMIVDVDAWLGHLNTVSAYRMLDDDTRTRLFAELGGGMPATIEINADLTLHTARFIGSSDVR